MPNVRAARPVDIGVGGERRRGGDMQVKAGVNRTLEIPQNALEHCSMIVLQRVHVQANLLHGVCYVWARQCEVL